MRYETQCGERLPFATKRSFGVGGSAILSTGHYRAFGSRADDTRGIAPGKVGYRQMVFRLF
ncbi:hypothetical protein [Desulfosporosinus hippei]|uniref:hypothetical protein n=1 Tax=Desulfosporosinus hippei TaxID=569859 RepID=UPI00115FE9B3|nr:hypothetical protein [Desulfosporosinus hippei]